MDVKVMGAFAVVLAATGCSNGPSPEECASRKTESACEAEPTSNSGCRWIRYETVSRTGDVCTRDPGFTCVYAEYYGDGCGGGQACTGGSGGPHFGEYYREVGDEVWLTPRCEELSGHTPARWGDCTDDGAPEVCNCVCLESGGSSTGAGTSTGTTG